MRSKTIHRIIRVSIVLCQLSQNGQGSNNVTTSDCDTKIIQGKPICITDAPYMVSLRSYENRHVCGGSIVSPYHVLTAAHCLDLFITGQTTRVVRIAYGAAHITAANSESSRVLRTSAHPYWDRYAIRFDVGVIKTVERFPIGRPNVRLIGIVAPNREPRDGEHASTGGWGMNSPFGGNPSPCLMALDVVILRHCTCRNYFLHDASKVNEDVVCAMASPSPGRGTCSGDSGSPLVSKVTKLQVGVTSWAVRPCGSGYPDGYANIAHPYIHGYIMQELLL